MTQAQLAERCSSRSSLGAYEAGQSEPKVTVLLDILRALGKDLHDFAAAYERAARQADPPAETSSLKELALRGRRVELETTGTSLANSAESARRAFFVVDLSEDAANGPGEEPIVLQELLDRLTSFTYRQAAVKEETQRQERREKNAADEDPLQAPRQNLGAKATR